MECLSLFEHVDDALSAPFVLPLETPLPASTARASLLLRDPPVNSFLSFWSAQLNRLDELISATTQLQKRWAAIIPQETLPAAGKLRLVALAPLSRSCGLVGAIWIRQFPSGLPLIGRLSQKGCFPVKDKETAKKTEKLGKISQSAPTRFEDRARKSGCGDAQLLWWEANGGIPERVPPQPPLLLWPTRHRS